MCGVCGGGGGVFVWMLFHLMIAIGIYLIFSYPGAVNLKSVGRIIFP